MTSPPAARDQNEDDRSGDVQEEARRVSPLAGIGFVMLLAGCATVMVGIMALHFNHNAGKVCVGVGALLILISVVLLAAFFRKSGH
ncbi:MAG: hypothetical protein ABJA87_12425 [bacterium]